MKDNCFLNGESKNVGIWIRVSTEDQARGDSPEIHQARARAYATAKGWNVQEIYDLAGLKGWSGKTIKDHPEAKRMLNDIKRGHISGLIFSKLARLARNTRELLDIADEFRLYGADMISLHETIDTSTPAGRLFFTMIAAMAQWEREETADRINASFLTRAKLGKLLNKNVPYGNRVEAGKMVLHPEEAPIRRQAFELFLQCRRKQAVARMLNEKGYRTRHNRMWREVQIETILTDPSAKGVYFFNRLKRIGSWKTTLKPEAEWGRIDCEPIVSEEVWNEVNKILEEQRKNWKKPGRLPAQTFSKLAWCKCGTKMYARTDSPKYLCRTCNNKIPIADLEAIFHQELQAFFAQPEKLANHLCQAEQTLKDKEALAISHQQNIQKVREEMTQTHRLYLDGQVTAKGFGEFYKPAEERLNQLLVELPKLQAEVDLLKVNRISSDEVLTEARSLYDRWPSLPVDERRTIAESLCEKIVIGENEIDITLSYLPTSKELCKNQTTL
jgi:site-specific DNA recombinase